MSDSLRPHRLQYARLPCPSLSTRVCSNSCPLSRWCHPTISSSAAPFSSRLQSFPASKSFSMSQLFTSGGQSTGASDLALILPMNIQDWIPLGWTGLILLSKGLSRLFSDTTVQKHHFFGTQPSLFRPQAARPGHQAPSGFCLSLLNTHPSSVINKAGVSNMRTLQQGQCQVGRHLPHHHPPP